MKFALLIYENETNFTGADAAEKISRRKAGHQAFGAANRAVIVGGAGLRTTQTATTVRALAKGAERSLHDGPFAETREQLGGFYLVDVPDMEAAVALALDMPVGQNGSIEVRQVMVE